MRPATWTATCEWCGRVQVVPADASLIIGFVGARMLVPCPGCERLLEEAVDPPTAELFQAAGAAVHVAAPSELPILAPAEVDPEMSEQVDSP